MSDVSGWLLDAIEALDERLSTPGPWLRRSQLAFVDGGRGTGKTSVLLTLEQLATKEWEPPPEAPDVVKRLAKGKRRLLWLETLDMEPMASDSHLFASILARIEACFVGPDRTHAPMLSDALDDLDDYERVAEELSRIHTDAVLAWNGHGYREQEPHTFAAGVRRQAQSSLRLNERLTNLLDLIAPHVGKRNNVREPIFVLPIDDFDLAPSRCLEFLRLVRAMTTPRLFFVVAGNIRIAESVLRLASEGELLQLVGGNALDPTMLRSHALEISANNMRKLVPPQQRTRLRDIDLERALTFRAGDDGPTFQEVLRTIFVERNNAAPCEPSEGGDELTIRWESLEDFLLLTPPSEPTAHLDVGYSGAGWVKGTPRQVVDRIADLHELIGLRCGTPGGSAASTTTVANDPWGERLLRTLLADFRRLIHEEWSLPVDDRERLVDRFREYSPLRLDFRSAFSLEWQPEERSRVDLRMEPNRTWKDSVWSSNDGAPRAQVVVRDGRPIRLRLRNFTQSDAPGAPLPLCIASSATFLHDLSCSLWGGYLTTGALTYSDQFECLVEVAWGAPLSGITVSWHLPEWWTFREYERFYAHWARRHPTCESLDERCSAWLASMLEVLLDRDYDDGPSGVSQERLRNHLVQLARELPRRNSRKYLRISALKAIGLLLAPESGTSAAHAEGLLTEALRSALLEHEVSERIRDRRAKRLRRVKGAMRSLEEWILYSAIHPDGALRNWLHRLEKMEQDLEGARKTSNVEPDEPGLIPRWLHRLKSWQHEDPEKPWPSPTQVKEEARRESLGAGHIDKLLRAIALSRHQLSNHPINRIGNAALVPNDAE